MSLQKFTSNFFIFTGTLIGLVILLQNIFSNTLLFVPQFWLIFGFLAGITYIAYLLVVIGIKRDPQIGVMAIMGANAVKLLLCMAFALVYILKLPGNTIIFLANFFSIYLLFSVFEIYCLLLNLRHPK